MLNVRSASVGIYLDAGSGNENPNENGAAHFIEHMLFKGTEKHTAAELSELQNILGGQINAYTTAETLCMHARVIDDQLPQALDLLADMMLHSTFNADELERERKVILDEIAMCEDDPEDAIMDLFMRTIYDRHPLGRPVIGTARTVTGLGRDDLIVFMEREFTPDRMVISCAGNINIKKTLKQIVALFGQLKPARCKRNNKFVMPKSHSGTVHEHRHLQQTHLCLGGDAPHRTHRDRFAFNLLMMALGGGTSSRLFQEIREKAGLAYNIEATVYPTYRSGCYTIESATSLKNLPRVIEMCRAELKKIESCPISQNELHIAQEQLRASLLFGLESTNTRMSRAASAEIAFNHHIPVEQTLAEIDRVTTKKLMATADKYLNNKCQTLVTIGRGTQNCSPIENKHVSLNKKSC